MGESKDREKAMQYLKSKMDMDIQDLNKQMEALLEDFKNLEESTQEEVQCLKNELEMNQGMRREKKSLRALESRLKRKVRQFFRRIKSLKEDLEELPNTIMFELQFRTEVLKNIKGNKKKSAWPLECCKETEVEQLFSQIQAMMVWKNAGL
ncbi:hypothetical protein TURU_021409 [Turdus rufiventris]|nr:hypothetical protein TURU_021409 [Turdus rufiventris]